mmetsp:Transcript_15478/g.10838  ORF Transcript_15478/g.10838 Transcript_15478/m.10838 type:complete len:277 (+) Transcript_15478:891-1721(+)
MVVLGEHPAVEVRGHVITDVHLSEVLVELHLLVIDLDALLEGNGEVVLAGIDGLGDTGVGAVSADHDVNLHVLLGAHALTVVVGIVDLVRGGHGVRAGGHVDASHEAIDGLGAELDGAVAEETVEDLTPGHADVLLRLEGLANGHLLAGRGDHKHLANLAVNNVLGKVELLDHAKGDGATAGLGVVHLALEDVGLDVGLLSEDLSSARAGRATADNGDTHLAVLVELHAHARGEGDTSIPAGGRERERSGGKEGRGRVSAEAQSKCDRGGGLDHGS